MQKNHEALLSKLNETAAKLFPDSIDKYIEYKSPYIEEMYKICGLIRDK